MFAKWYEYLQRRDEPCRSCRLFRPTINPFFLVIVLLPDLQGTPSGAFQRAIGKIEVRVVFTFVKLKFRDFNAALLV